MKKTKKVPYVTPASLPLAMTPENLVCSSGQGEDITSDVDFEDPFTGGGLEW